MKVYLIGALKNRGIIDLGVQLREHGLDVFDDWLSPGPEADEQWQEYERLRGRTYKGAIYGEHASTVFNFDYRHLAESDVVVMVLPCGKSGHLEFGWAIGQGKRGYILFDQEPERYDIMYRFATEIYFHPDELLHELLIQQAERVLR